MRITLITIIRTNFIPSFLGKASRALHPLASMFLQEGKGEMIRFLGAVLSHLSSELVRAQILSSVTTVLDTAMENGAIDLDSNQKWMTTLLSKIATKRLILV